MDIVIVIKEDTNYNNFMDLTIFFDGDTYFVSITLPNTQIITYRHFFKFLKLLWHCAPLILIYVQINFWYQIQNKGQTV